MDVGCKRGKQNAPDAGHDRHARMIRVRECAMGMLLYELVSHGSAQYIPLEWQLKTSHGLA
jgi:hypothetical protein